MATTPSTNSAGKATRYTALRTMLKDRRCELMTAVHDRLHVRADGLNDRDVLDEGEISDADIQDDLELALLQMKSEALGKVRDALRRLDAGAYGYCFECGGQIAKARLRALPFAVRCKDCEEACEKAEERERLRAHRRRPPTFLFDLSR